MGIGRERERQRERERERERERKRKIEREADKALKLPQSTLWYAFFFLFCLLLWHFWFCSRLRSISCPNRVRVFFYIKTMKKYLLFVFM